MRFQAITQIILILLSLVIIFTVIRPMFATIQANQVEVQKFKDALVMASQFNAKLAELQARANSFSASDLDALERYVPNEIDILEISRDIVLIAEGNDLLVQTLEVAEAAEIEEEVQNESVPFSPSDPLDPNGFVSDTGNIIAEEANSSIRERQFTLNAIGTYEQMKQALVDFERNAYPLRLIGFELLTEEENSALYNFKMELESYALNF